MRVFLATLPGNPFFVNSGLLSCGKTSVEVDTRETLQNKGFRSHSRLCASSIPCGVSKKTSFCGPVLRIIFCGVTILYGSMFEFCRIWVSKVKNPWGCRTELVLKRVFFAVCPLRAQIWRAGGARPVSFFSVVFGCLSKMASRLRCRGFFRLFRSFLLTPFSQTSSGPLPIPLFVLGCFSLLFAFFLGLVATPHCTCVFWAVGFQPFLSFGGFWGLLRKTLFFPLKKGYLGSFLSVSFLCLPFVRPLASFTSLCHFLSLSLYFSLSLSLFLSLSLSLSSFLFFFFLVVLSLL